MGFRSTQNGKRYRRYRRRGRTTPAKAQEISTRCRHWRKHAKWIQTKEITRFHRQRKYRSDD